MNRKEFAEKIGLTPRQVDNLAVEGLPRTNEGRRYDYDIDSAVWYYERKVARLEDQKREDRNAEDRLTLARAEKAELELAQMRREVVPIAEVRTIWGRYLDQLRAILLNLSATLAPRVVGVKTVRQASAQLDEGVREVLSLLQSVADEYGSTRRAKKRTRKRTGRRSPRKTQAAS